MPAARGFRPKEPGLAGFPTTLAYVESALVGDAADDRYRAGCMGWLFSRPANRALLVARKQRSRVILVLGEN